MQVKINDKARAQALEALLDRGLAPELDDRFQTIAELIERLEGVDKPQARESCMIQADDAKQVSREILLSDRTSQLSQVA